MPEESITSSVCHKLRTEIYSMIFPRWALLLIIMLVAGMLGTLYTLNGRTTVAAANAMKRAELVDMKFTVEIEHLKSGQKEIKNDLKEQRAILQRIDRSVNGR